MNNRNPLRQVRNTNLQGIVVKYFSLITLAFTMLIFTVLSDHFLTLTNLGSLLKDEIPTLCMAYGMTFVLLIGSIDLSVSATCMISNILLVTLMTKFAGTGMALTLNFALALSIALVFSVVSGIFLAFCVVNLKVPSFIASLGVLYLWKSLALMISKSYLGLPKSVRAAFSWMKTDIWIFNVSVLIALLILVLLLIVQNKTALGKQIYAIGSNERAARIAGIPVAKVKYIVFGLSGLLSGIAGMFVTMKMQSSSPLMGETYMLSVIAATVMGGTALTGGRGNLIFTLLGVLIVTTIKNGMNMVGVDMLWQNIVFGAAVLVAVAITSDRSNKNLIVK